MSLIAVDLIRDSRRFFARGFLPFFSSARKRLRAGGRIC